MWEVPVSYNILTILMYLVCIVSGMALGHTLGFNKGYKRGWLVRGQSIYGTESGKEYKKN